MPQRLAFLSTPSSTSHSHRIAGQRADRAREPRAREPQTAAVPPRKMRRHRGNHPHMLVPVAIWLGSRKTPNAHKKWFKCTGVSQSQPRSEMFTGVVDHGGLARFQRDAAHQSPRLKSFACARRSPQIEVLGKRAQACEVFRTSTNHPEPGFMCQKPVGRPLERPRGRHGTTASVRAEPVNLHRTAALPLLPARHQVQERSPHFEVQAERLLCDVGVALAHGALLVQPCSSCPPHRGPQPLSLRKLSGRFPIDRLLRSVSASAPPAAWPHEERSLSPRGSRRRRPGKRCC